MQNGSNANTCYALIQHFVLSDSEFELFPFPWRPHSVALLQTRTDFVLSINLFTTQFFFIAQFMNVIAASFRACVCTFPLFQKWTKDEKKRDSAKGFFCRV